MNLVKDVSARSRRSVPCWRSLFRPMSASVQVSGSVRVWSTKSMFRFRPVGVVTKAIRFFFIRFLLLGCVACLSIRNHRRRGRIRTCRKEGWKRLTGVQWMVVNDRIHSSATIIIIGLKSSIYLQPRLHGDHTALVKPCAKCPIKTQKMFRSL